MNFGQFLAKYDNKAVDVDYGFPHNQPYQCWDVGAAYCRDVMGVPEPWLRTTDTNGSVYTSFRDFPSPLPQFFIKVPNDPNNAAQIPPPGSLVFFGPNKANGFAGHVALVISSWAGGFVSLDQNWYPGPPARRITHDYSNVVGWLTPKPKEIKDMPTTLDSAKALANMAVGRDPNDPSNTADLAKYHVGADPNSEILAWYNSGERASYLQGRQAEVQNLRNKIAELEAVMNDLSKRPTKDDLELAIKKVADLTVELSDAHEKIKKYDEEAKKPVDQEKAVKGWLGDLLKRIHDWLFKRNRQ